MPVPAMSETQMKDLEQTHVLDVSPRNFARHLLKQKYYFLDMSRIKIQREVWLRFAARKKTLTVLYPCLELVRVPFSEVKFVAERLSSRHEFLKT